MKRIEVITAAVILSAFCFTCARVNYELVRTPVSSVKKEKPIQFSINSNPPGASTYIDSIAVGPTPVTVKTAYICNDVTYKSETVLKVRRAGGDIGVGAGLIGGAALFGAMIYMPAQENDESGIAALSVITAGLGTVGLALLIRGIVLKSKHGKIKSSEEKTVEECPVKNWKVVLTKENYMPAERVLKISDAQQNNYIALTPASILSTSAPPPAALDKTALLSSMAAKTDALTGKETAISKDSKAIVQQRMKEIMSTATVGEGYEVAGDDLYFSIESGEIKMLEMTTETDYCYIISAIAEKGSRLYMAVFREEIEITKDFNGSDVASVQFCSKSSDPVRVTTSSETDTTIGLRIHFLAK